MADLEPALEQKLYNVTKAQLVAKSPEYGEQHNVSRELQIVESCAGAFVEAPVTLTAVVNPLTQRGPISFFASGLGLAVRA